MSKSDKETVDKTIEGIPLWSRSWIQVFALKNWIVSICKLFLNNNVDFEL